MELFRISQWISKEGTQIQKELKACVFKVRLDTPLGEQAKERAMEKKKQVQSPLTHSTCGLQIVISCEYLLVMPFSGSGTSDGIQTSEKPFNLLNPPFFPLLALNITLNLTRGVPFFTQLCPLWLSKRLSLHQPCLSAPRHMPSNVPFSRMSMPRALTSPTQFRVPSVLPPQKENGTFFLKWKTHRSEVFFPS